MTRPPAPMEVARAIKELRAADRLACGGSISTQRTPRRRWWLRWSDGFAVGVALLVAGILFAGAALELRHILSVAW